MKRGKIGMHCTFNCSIPLDERKAILCVPERSKRLTKPSVPATHKGKLKPWEEASNQVAKLLRSRIKNELVKLKRPRMYIVPQSRQVVHGKEYLVPTSTIARNEGLLPDMHDLNYWHLP